MTPTRDGNFESLSAPSAHLVLNNDISNCTQASQSSDKCNVLAKPLAFNNLKVEFFNTVSSGTLSSCDNYVYIAYIPDDE